MQTRNEAMAYGLSFPNTYTEAPFHDPNWDLVRVKGSKKAFLWIYEKDGLINLNVKVSPEWRDFYRQIYKRMIAESYDIVTDSPTKRIYEAVKKIPKGKVATYGQVALLAGNGKMSRAVGNALHHNPDPENIPCYRVVNAKGELAGEFAFGGCGVQRKLLEADGITFIGDRVDLEQCAIRIENGVIV